MSVAGETRQLSREIQVAHGLNGVVASGHTLATEAATQVLRSGGNAVDAAVAGALVLAVVCPYACTLAGDVYFLIHDPKTRAVTGLNGTGRSPQAATLEQFSVGIPRDGALSVTVPGFLAGLHDTLQRFGTRPFASLMAPARALATEGFAVSSYFARNVRDRAALLARDPAAADLFLPNGVPLQEGTTFRQPDLANMLAIIEAEGPESFYRGEVANRMLAAGERIGWLIGRDDLAQHKSLEQKPISAPFHGHDVWTMPPNSYGATLLLQLLALEAGGIANVDPDSVDFILRGFEARRAAYKVAGQLIGDPALLEAPLRALLERARTGFVQADAAMPMPPESRDRCTTNVVVVDRDGLAVSLIQSISAPCGAGVVLPATGILLNNRLAGFVNNPGSANCIAPGKRPAHTLAPCLITKSGKLTMTIGTPGTVGQTCVLAQFLARTLACGQDLKVAADRPRWSVDFQGQPVIEDTLDEDELVKLRGRLPNIRTMPSGWISFGSIKLVKAEDDGCVGLADHRRSATTAALN
ncbi:gamma-glutamyltransferase [Methylocella sp. CPCC 101449]|uniref:gamma-glutamyltransferase family protein n=1 Tax=Methylocella sp. CPCC 101449 TaxID=2987531 RepID=UPI00288DAFE7|nr:gamma-glutamyltransferase [Methylocella sp. CPCC 101449]MDT2019524.1 gamma-glutamyltransferase [Methylocella sp. CPCC 101449]